MELNEYATRALKRVSPIYANSAFIKEFYQGLGADYEKVREHITSLRGQSFIDTVDWGIEYQELKYSLDIRRDLSLEERRARLGIKARKHLPLNPATLEKYLKEYYDLEAFLYEKNAGYIWLYLNWLTKASWEQAVEFLLKEKPAHLMLGAAINQVEFIGQGTFDADIYPPGKPFPLPKTPADKINYPRIFAGTAQLSEGNALIGLKEPESEVGFIKAGAAQVALGEKTIAPAQLRHSALIRHAGVALFIGGEITIDTADIVEMRIIENPYGDLAIADIAKARGDAIYEPPIFDIDEHNVIKIFWKFATSRHRRFRGVALPNPREDLTKEEIKEVADYAVEHQLLKNARGEVINGSIGAALKTYELVRRVI